MRPRSRSLTLALVVTCACDRPELLEAGPLVDLVDPTIGTGGFAFAYGATFLGAAAPHGLVKLGPDTTGTFGEIRFVHTSGNWAEDPTILCFSHLHLHGTGVPEAGVVAMMPTTSFDPATPRAVAYQATRVDERARAGVYAVTLAEPDIRVELAAPGPHVGVQRITFPDGTADGVVVLDLFRTLIEGIVTEAAYDVTGAEASAAQIGTSITGSLHTEGSLSPPNGYDVFFAMTASEPFVSTDTGFGAALSFGARDTTSPVTIAVALSYVDVDGALANLAAEHAVPDYARAALDARAQWDALLAQVRVFCDGDCLAGTPAALDREMFASSLYRSFLMPTIESDVDGRWRGPDGVVRTAEGFRMMTDMSLWDTYRSVHPLYALIAPASARDAALSIAAFTEVSGTSPLWTMATGDARVMVGSPAEVVLADALQRGVIDKSALEAAWPVLRAAALDEQEPANGRNGRNDVIAYDAMGGWVPSPLRGPVSKTLEYAIADRSLARIARALDHDADADRLDVRARGWRALFDPATGFLRGRDATGAFVIPAEAFVPEQSSDDYVEANAWQSSFPYDDVAGFIQVHGSREAALAKLDEMLTLSELDWATRDPGSDTFGISPLPYHWQGNEPSNHVPALAYELGGPGGRALGGRFVGWVMDTQYNADTNGLPGNDDGGALSSWWALAALGLHAIPGSGDWVLGAPRFPRVEIDVTEAGATRTLAIVRGAFALDGKALEAVRLDHALLVGATELALPE